MATISGRVIFDRDRSLTVSTGDSGIAGIPVVLQNTVTGVRLTVLTDANGNYSFINVPNGNYRIVEAYGTPGGVASPGNFADAQAGSIPVGTNPPIGARNESACREHEPGFPYSGYAVCNGCRRGYRKSEFFQRSGDLYAH